MKQEIPLPVQKGSPYILAGSVVGVQLHVGTILSMAAFSKQLVMLYW
jgi:hypothetical protein